MPSQHTVRKSLKTNEVKVKRPKLVPVELAQELLSATDVVIATPMWNWNCPAVLKAYIDAIVIPGVLGAGEGKLAGKRITVVISQGGAYGPGTGIAPGMEGLVDQKATNIATATEEVK